MLLIFFLGLIVKFTLVSGECDIGTQDVKNFDWSRFSGPRPWYWRLHTPDGLDNILNCPISTYAPPEGNRTLVTVDAYNISKQSHITIYGNATYWDQTGYWEEIFQEPLLTNVRAYVIAVDYDRYVILKSCLLESNKTNVYVAYRSQRPDEETEKEVLKELKQNNIDVSQLVEYRTDHCQ